MFYLLFSMYTCWGPTVFNSMLSKNDSVHLCICKPQASMYRNKLVKNSTEGDIAPALGEMTTVCNVGEANRVMVHAWRVCQGLILGQNKIYMRFLLHAFENCYWKDKY